MDALKYSACLIYVYFVVLEQGRKRSSYPQSADELRERLEELEEQRSFLGEYGVESSESIIVILIYAIYR